MADEEHGFPFPSPLTAQSTPCIWHGLRVEIAPSGEPPFAVDAVVIEDDTWQVLGAEPEFSSAAEHPIRLMQELREAEPLEPGSVFIKEGAPVRLHAIVHDLDCEPSWREEWIAGALCTILRIAADRSLEALGMPLLGTRHGHLPAKTSMRLLDESLAQSNRRTLEKLWIVIQ